VAAKSPVAAEPKPAETPELPTVAEAPGADGPLETAEVLDLNSFVTRLEAFLEQLRKAELPAAAFMVEAIGLRRFDSNAANQCWSEIVETVQRNLRGIDVPCLYRPFTLCVFMPGCSLDAGVARAAKIKIALRDAVLTWNNLPFLPHPS
jgi:hypothetical protein